MLETTGLADPAPVLQTAMAHPYLVDALPARRRGHGGRRGQRRARTLDAHMEAVKQVGGRRPAGADQAGPSSITPERRARTDLSCACSALNPAAPILDAAAGEADAGTPPRLRALRPRRERPPDVNRWLAEEAYAAAQTRSTTITTSTTCNRHDARIRAFSFASDAGDPRRDVRDVHSIWCARCTGRSLLRLKGIVKLAGDARASRW